MSVHSSYTYIILPHSDIRRRALGISDSLSVRMFVGLPALIARFMGPTWGPSGADRSQVGPVLVPWTLLFECLSVATGRRGTALGISVSLYLHLSVDLFVGLPVSHLIQEEGVLVCTVNLSVHLSAQLSVCLPSCLFFMHYNNYIYEKVMLEYTPVAFFLNLHYIYILIKYFHQKTFINGPSN